MIKFFRNLRKNLLIEGKTTKYFKYALGEIILVVIGILIALQVNNWNEQKKAKIEVANFYENVLLDLEKDEDKLDYYEKFHVKRVEYLDTLLTYVRNPNKIMGLQKFGKYVEPIFYSVNPSSYSTTFESAKVSGIFNNIKNKNLIKELSQYYADFVVFESTLSSITRFIENHFEPIMYNLPENYITKETGDLVINEEDVTDFYAKIASIKDYRNITADYQMILKTPKLENYLIGDMGRTFGAIGVIKYRKIKLKELIEKISHND